MTASNFAFTPADGLRNAVSFPTTPASEADARNQPQTLLDQLRDYINTTIVTELNNKLALSGGNLTGALASNNTLAGTALIATGLTGVTQASRYVGATAIGAPATGTFVKGDFVVDQSGALWVCTTAGTPGTWVKVGGGAAIINGTYTGDGTTDRLISLGSVPKLVWVLSSTHSAFLGFPESATNISGAFQGVNQASSTPVNMNGDQGGAGGGSNSVRIRAASNGFLVSGASTGNSNQNGITYKYWALV